MLVIDDRTLLAVLAERAPEPLLRAADAGEVFTTPAWYYRLARAVHDVGFSGSLSRMVEVLDDDLRRQVTDALDELPATIGILSARVLVPVMVQLSQVRRLNLLNSEAVAAAMVLGAHIQVTVAGELLRSACSILGVELDVISV